MNLLTPFLGIVSNYIIVRHAKRFILFSKSSDCIIKNLIVKTMHPRRTKNAFIKRKSPVTFISELVRLKRQRSKSKKRLSILFYSYDSSTKYADRFFKCEVVAQIS